MIDFKCAIVHKVIRYKRKYEMEMDRQWEGWAGRGDREKKVCLKMSVHCTHT